MNRVNMIAVRVLNAKLPRIDLWAVDRDGIAMTWYFPLGIGITLNDINKAMTSAENRIDVDCMKLELEISTGRRVMPVNEWPTLSVVQGGITIVLQGKLYWKSSAVPATWSKVREVVMDLQR